MASTLNGAIADLREAQQLGAILQQCFNFPAANWQPYSNLLGLENYRVIRCGGKAIAGLGIPWASGSAAKVCRWVASQPLALRRTSRYSVAAELMRRAVRSYGLTVFPCQPFPPRGFIAR